MKKKLPVLLLSAALCMTMAPVTGLADELGGSDTAEKQTVTDLELDTGKKDKENKEKSEVQWTGFKWNSYSEAEVTLTASENGICYYKWVECGADGNSEIPQIETEGTGEDEILISKDEDFVITLNDLDTDKEVDLYIQIEDEKGKLSDMKRLRLLKDSRPEKEKGSSGKQKISKPKAGDSTIEGLDTPLEFYPDTFYDFSVTGAGTDNKNPEDGDIKWVPLYWSMSANPNSSRIRSTWKIGSKEGISQEGTFNIYVFFRKYICKDSDWKSTDTIQAVQYKVQSAPLSEK